MFLPNEEYSKFLYKKISNTNLTKFLGIRYKFYAISVNRLPFSAFHKLISCLLKY